MVNKDVKNESIVEKYQEDANVERRASFKIPSFVSEACNAFHKFGMWLTIAMAIGIYIGVIATGKFYTTKMDECVAIGGMIHKTKVYTLTPK